MDENIGVDRPEVVTTERARRRRQLLCRLLGGDSLRSVGGHAAGAMYHPMVQK